MPQMAGTRALIKDHAIDSSVQPEDLYDGFPVGNDTDGCVKLGEGLTASVYKIRHRKTGTEYALKVIKLTRVPEGEKRDMLLAEIPMLASLDHPGTVKVIEVFRKLNTLFIVMELCTGGELFDKVVGLPGGRMNEQMCRPLAKSMLGALRYLHSKGIVHRDLKLENFILTDKTPTAQIKLIDFGFSRSYLESGGPMNEVVGTPFYFAPEVLERSYTVQADLWSFGVVIFMMLTGTPPFCGKTTKNIVDGIHRASKNQAKTTKRIAAMLSRVPVSTQGIDFVTRLLTVDPSARMTAADALNHEWIATMTQSFDDRDPAGAEEIHQLALANLKAFSEQDQLQRSAMLALSFNVSTDELSGLNEEFQAMDLDGNGTIDLEEFVTAFSGKGSSKDELESAFKAIDQDGTGAIEYSEFIAAAMSQRQMATAENLEAAFYRIDFDDSGTITKDELGRLLGDAHDPEALALLLETADIDGDGEITLAEFKAAIIGGKSVAASKLPTGMVPSNATAPPMASGIGVTPAWVLIEVSMAKHYQKNLKGEASHTQV